MEAPVYTLYGSPAYDIATLNGILTHFYSDDMQEYTEFKLTYNGNEQRAAFDSLSNCINETKY